LKTGEDFIIKPQEKDLFSAEVVLAELKFESNKNSEA
jgi:hypothetical protein